MTPDKAKIKRRKRVHDRLSQLGETFLNASLRAFFYTVDRLQEPSTIRGVIVGLSGIFSFIKPERIDVIVPLGLVIAGAVGAFMPDKLRDRANKGQKKTEGSK